MAADDPLTPGEIRRAIERLERANTTLGDRVTQVASAALSAQVWAAEHRALTERLDRHEKNAEDNQERLEREINTIREERDKRSEITWTKVIGLITALATLAAVVVSVIGLTKGIK